MVGAAAGVLGDAASELAEGRQRDAPEVPVGLEVIAEGFLRVAEILVQALQAGANERK